MVVNSINFLLFFTVFLVGYYILGNAPKTKNLWLLIGSYFFYGIADWRMLLLLFSATIIFYGLGYILRREMNKQHIKSASIITTLAVILGVCILLYFKYFNFFGESIATLLNALGLNTTWTTLNIVLPIGVSFFTFKFISYIIEIHREHIEPCRDFIEFATYISFFPTILSGPIDRPNTFLPQLKKDRCFDYDLTIDGCRQILWGMFTKMCIADNLATLTDSVWDHYSTQSSFTLVTSALLYCIQIYTDFDGYSNMAIGVSKILGFKVARNFNHPLLARNTAEYWRRWHMSLTSWITDYVFMPLNISFRDWGKYGVILAIMINLIVIGFWHGANWTYGLYGLYHGLLFIPLVFSGAFGRNKKLKSNTAGLPKGSDFLKMIGTFIFITFGLIIFRAPSATDAYHYIVSIFLNEIPTEATANTYIRPIAYIFILIMIAMEWTTRKNEHPLQFSNKFFKNNILIRWAVYYAIVFAIIQFQGLSSSFIYFQF